MLNKKLFILLMVISLFIANVVFAQTRTVVTLGGSWWNAAYSFVDEDGKELAEIGNGNNFGPYISINHGKVNFGASLLFGTFPVDAYNLGLDIFDLDTDVNMSRNDLNFTLGYRVLPNLNVFAGAKYLKLAIDVDIKDIPTEYDDWGNPIDFDDANIKLNDGGMMYGLGASAVIPLGTAGMYAFGSIAVMGGIMKSDTTISFMELSEEFEGSENAAVLGALNLGLGYRFPSGLGINVGYRADLLNRELEQVDEIIQTRINVQGLIVTASYSF